MNIIKTIDLGEACRILEGCAKRAAEIGVPMAFAVVDAAGRLVALHRMDGANWQANILAEGKANAAAAMRQPTLELVERWSNFPALVTALSVAHDGRFVPLNGGVPVKVDGVVIGAVGASGGTGAQDADAVSYGIAQAMGGQPAP
jgi:uncharacterized protein GlcG (DUF336 family)